MITNDLKKSLKSIAWDINVLDAYEIYPEEVDTDMMQDIQLIIKIAESIRERALENVKKETR